ncbi:MAG: hypothetical protein SOT17_03340 [Lactobacillus johnsonii]|nr:hypothetical protein [Lactobacillus johnsonii]MDY2874289.1 hypothetical protein [Lactobacillus johnsonii]
MISFSSALSILKSAQDLAEKIKNRELNEALVSLQQELLSLGDKNLELQEKYVELKKYIEIPEDIFIDKDGFICKKDDSNKYCPHCWNKYRKLCLMPKEGVREIYDVPKPYVYQCSACKWTVDSSKKSF